jgi:hypothetical protein
LKRTEAREQGKNGLCKSYKKEEQMEATVKEKEETTVQEGKRGGRKWGSLIFKFLMYGGWLLVLIFFLAIYIFISIYFK